MGRRICARFYRRVRHPIYLGLALLAMGETLAFGSWPALILNPGSSGDYWIT
jgi:protein-S-isoprenylcysteine O-methyltransferase Ste14